MKMMILKSIGKSYQNAHMRFFPHVEKPTLTTHQGHYVGALRFGVYCFQAGQHKVNIRKNTLEALVTWS